MKRKALAAVAGAVALVAVTNLTPSVPLRPPCVARQPNEPETVCRRKVLGMSRTVEPLVPFSASEMVGWCRPIACPGRL